MTLLGNFVRTREQGEQSISWRSMNDMSSIRSSSRDISFLMRTLILAPMLLSLLLFSINGSFSSCPDISTKFPSRVIHTPRGTVNRPLQLLHTPELSYGVSFFSNIG